MQDWDCIFIQKYIYIYSSCGNSINMIFIVDQEAFIQLSIIIVEC